MPFTSLIPKGYTFLNPSAMISKRAFDRFLEIQESSDNRNPDDFKMYIYNDYFAYAQLDLVDTELSAIHAKIAKKNWDEAYVLLEGLTAFFGFGSCLWWPMIDDGEQTWLTDRVYGASLVTVLRALKKEGRLDVEHFPSLEFLLREGARWGKDIPCRRTEYDAVLRGIGERLFANKSAETLALEKARVEEWMKMLSEEDQEEIRKHMEGDDSDDDDDDDDEEEEEEEEEEEVVEKDEKPWWKEGTAYEDFKSTDLTLSRVWKEYRDHLRMYPSIPARGPPYWDLTEWSDQDKAPFLFENIRKTY